MVVDGLLVYFYIINFFNTNPAKNNCVKSSFQMLSDNIVLNLGKIGFAI